MTPARREGSTTGSKPSASIRCATREAAGPSSEAMPSARRWWGTVWLEVGGAESAAPPSCSPMFAGSPETGWSRGWTRCPPPSRSQWLRWFRVLTTVLPEKRAAIASLLLSPACRESSNQSGNGSSSQRLVASTRRTPSSHPGSTPSRSSCGTISTTMLRPSGRPGPLPPVCWPICSAATAVARGAYWARWNRMEVGERVEAIHAGMPARCSARASAVPARPAPRIPTPGCGPALALTECSCRVPA